jgi:hypothetical protein
VVYVSIICRALVGLVFAASGASKFVTRERFREFVEWLGALPLPFTAARRPIAVVAAASEVGIVVLIAVPATATVGLVTAGAMLLGFAGMTLLLLKQGNRTPCRCFGRTDAPLGIRHLIRDLVLASAAFLSALNVGISPSDAGGVALSLFGATLVAVVVVGWDDVLFIILGARARSA